MWVKIRVEEGWRIESGLGSGEAATNQSAGVVLIKRTISLNNTTAAEALTGRGFAAPEPRLSPPQLRGEFPSGDLKLREGEPVHRSRLSPAL